MASYDLFGYSFFSSENGVLNKAASEPQDSDTSPFAPRPHSESGDVTHADLGKLSGTEEDDDQDVCDAPEGTEANPEKPRKRGCRGGRRNRLRQAALQARRLREASKLVILPGDLTRFNAAAAAGQMNPHMAAAVGMLSPLQANAAVNTPLSVSAPAALLTAQAQLQNAFAPSPATAYAAALSSPYAQAMTMPPMTAPGLNPAAAAAMVNPLLAAQFPPNALNAAAAANLNPMSRQMYLAEALATEQAYRNQLVAMQLFGRGF